MRQNQFLKWFENIFKNFEQDANRTKNNRQCISQRFPDNNPGLINRLGFIQFYSDHWSNTKGSFKFTKMCYFLDFFLKNLWKIYLKTCIKHKKRNPWNGLCFRNDFSGIRLQRARRFFPVVV